MKFLTYFSRLFVGSLFIVSGIIKANDPLGFSYKLEEYFSSNVLNLPFLESYALAFSLVISISEVVLGIAVLLGSKARLTNWLLLLLIVFFTFLTFYSAYFNKVTDCGCFGDALKLTPWQSFTKDVVLLFFILILFFRSRHIHRNTPLEDVILLPVALVFIAIFSLGVIKWSFPVIFSAGVFLVLAILKRVLIHLHIDWIMAIIATAVTSYFSVYCLNHLPVKDFRPYAIGKSIKEGRAVIKPEKSEIYLVYKNIQTGEEKEYPSSNYPWNDSAWASTWQFVKQRKVIVEAGIDAPIHDFNLISPDGNDYTEDILNESAIFLVVAYDINKTNEKAFAEIKKFADEANKQGFYLYGVSSSSDNIIEEFRHEHQLMFDFYTADATMLKTMIRSNPGLVLLMNGRVAGLWHHNDIPDFENVKQITGSKGPVQDKEE